MGGDPEAVEDWRRLEVVRALRRCTSGSKLVGTTTDICERLAEEGLEGINAQELLKEWGFSQKSMRLLGRGPRRAWDISDTKLARVEKELAAIPPYTPPRGDYSDYTS